MLEMQNVTTTQHLRNIKAPKSGTYGCHFTLAMFYKPSNLTDFWSESITEAFVERVQTKSISL